MLRPLLVTLLLLGCGPRTPATGEGPRPGPPPAPADLADAAAAAPDAAPPGCLAGPDECCQADGTIVKATCAPRDNGPSRNPDGSCGECQLRCLPGSARIATPDGERVLSTLRVGDLVWTLDRTGARVARPIAELGRREAPPDHAVLRLRLADGRVITASPGHPLADGRRLDALAPGAPLDGSEVTSRELVPLAGDATWDLLPAGDTGLYFADGVLLGSTL